MGHPPESDRDAPTDDGDARSVGRAAPAGPDARIADVFADATAAWRALEPMRRLTLATAAALALLGGGAAWLAQAPPEPVAVARPDPGPPARRLAQLPPFDRAEVEAELDAARDALRAGEAARAEGLVARLAARRPELIEPAVLLARAAMRRGDLAAAASRLADAARRGLRAPDAVAAAAVFAPLRGRPDFDAALEAMRAPPLPAAAPPPPALPASVADGVARIEAGSIEWSPVDGAVRALFADPPPPPDGPPEIVAGGASPEARLVNRLHAEGRAAGNRGDLYENRDDDHSRLDLDRFPQMIALEHGPEAVAAGLHRGLADPLALQLGAVAAPPVIGNASVAITAGPLWRSMPRRALTTPGEPEIAWRAYAANRLYVYPEHKDHDPFFGDLMPAQTPYWIVTQGSSWSDEAALRALALTLAAFPPETKRRLVAERLIGPTLQMIWRRGQAGIETDGDYLSARAHPTAFEPERAEPLRMVERAQALTPDAIPPMVRLEVEAEARPARAVELFGDGLERVLFDTPSAVARLFRGGDRTLRMRVSAAGTTDPNGRPLTFRWVLVRGAPDRVAIRPQDADGRVAEIAVDWHEDPPPLGGLMRGQRVEIAVIADNGATLSAPAFVSVALPPRERRIYDAEGRLQMVDYDAIARQDRYRDPSLWPERNWRDVHSWTADGRPLGWHRTGDPGFGRFTRHGALIRREDSQGRPLLAERMAYPLAAGSEGGRKVVPRPMGSFLEYAYEGPEDRLGVARPAAPAAGDGAGDPGGGAPGTMPEEAEAPRAEDALNGAPRPRAEGSGGMLGAGPETRP